MCSYLKIVIAPLAPTSRNYSFRVLAAQTKFTFQSSNQGSNFQLTKRYLNGDQNYKRDKPKHYNCMELYPHFEQDV